MEHLIKMIQVQDKKILKHLDLIYKKDDVMDYIDSIKKTYVKIVVVNFAAYKSDSLLVNQD